MTNIFRKPSLNRPTRRWAVSASITAIALSSPVFAQDKPTNPTVEADSAEEQAVRDIIVTARGAHMIGVAASSNEGVMVSGDFDNRPLLRPAEVLEAIPGLIATQHSGGGKANQYFLRGFNLDHGTDLALHIDDVPINFRTHGHGQGYLDVGGLIPETLERMDFRKGPYRAEDGDFGLVASARFRTKDTIDPFVRAEVGAFNHRRLVVGTTVPLAKGDLTFAGQLKFYDGPWEQPEELSNISTLVKYTKDASFGTIRASGQYYRARWKPTDQIPERAIGTILGDAFGSLDNTLTGRSDRLTLTMAVEGNADWDVSVWAQHYDWSLFSNFTYFLEDPINGDQIRQYETRWSYGGKATKTFNISDQWTMFVGAETRFDDISQIGLDKSTAGLVTSTKSQFSVSEDSIGVFGEVIWRPLPRVMVVGGLRADHFGFTTRPLAGDAWGGRATDTIISPKIGANVEIADGIALYANYGEGFHSNDARGVTAPNDPAPGLVKGSFRELGVRFERKSLVLAANYWWSTIDSELIYVGDSGAVEPNGAGRRHGLEVFTWWRPTKWLTIDAVWTATTSRFVDLPSGENFIPGALKSSGELGVAVDVAPFNASLRIRHLGPHPLIEDNSAEGKSTTIVNTRLAYETGPWEFSFELLNALDNRDHDIDYFYATRLPGEPAEGIEGYNIKVSEPRQIRFGATMRF